MKKLNTTLCVLALGLAAFAQAPESMSYQAVARNGAGEMLANSALTVRFTLKQASSTGTIVYQETHAVTTNTFGLFTASIGRGTTTSGTFSAIDWGMELHFLQVEVDPGSGYLDMGTTQLLSVPYALYAKEAGAGGGGTYQAGSGIGITGNTITNTAPDQTVALTGSGATQVTGTYPNFNISSTDSDNQMLSISGSNLSISGGNTVTLPSGGGSGTVTQVNTGTGLTGGPITSSGTVSLANTTVSPGSYGSASQVATFTVDAHGRLTSASNNAISGLLPAGTSGQSLRHDGTGWTANSLLYNNGTRIGIGTTSPSGMVQIHGSENTSQLVVQANATQANTQPLIRLRNSAGITLMHIHSDRVENVFIGLGAGQANAYVAPGQGVNNTFVGSSAGITNTSGSSNTAMGYRALFVNTTGSKNIALGAEAMVGNTSGSGNVAIGWLALQNNAGGDNYVAIGEEAMRYITSQSQHNVAVGYQALRGSTNLSMNLGTDNTAVGYNALKVVALGGANTAIGSLALQANVNSGSHTAVGAYALFANTTGDGNTAIGRQALGSNTSGSNNTAVGVISLNGNTSGYSNLAYGNNSLNNNTTGWQNTVIGMNSGQFNTTGSYNTALGYNTGPNASNRVNTTCVGIDATGTASDQVRIGNVFVNSIGGYANWTNISDGRFKVDVEENVPGLSFIALLRPVSYRLDRGQINETTGVIERRRQILEDDPEAEFYSGSPYSAVTTGFIAQEVEAAAMQLGFRFSGVDAPQNEDDLYGLRYAEFVVPLVKAVQEQQVMIQEQEAVIELLRLRIEALEQK